VPDMPTTVPGRPQGATRMVGQTNGGGTVTGMRFINPRATDVSSARHVLVCAVDRVQRAHERFSPNVLQSALPSPCVADLEACPDGEHRDLFKTYVYVVLGLRGVAEEHLLTLADLLVRRLRPQAVATVARASMEASAQASWLQAPELDTRGRLGRLGSAMLDSAHELCKAGRAAGDASVVEAELAEISSVLVGVGFEIRRPDKGTPFVEGASRPSVIDLIAAGLNDGGRRGEVAYRFPSAAAHAQLHAVLGQYLREDSEDLVAGEGPGGMTTGEIGLLTAWSLDLYLLAVQRWGIYTGWPDDLVPELGQLLNRRLDGPQTVP
jgi:hypothetical protein